MGYVVNHLVCGVKLGEEFYKSEIKPLILKYCEKNTDINDEDFKIRIYLKDEGIILNYGYYHSEYVIGIDLMEEDSDIRTGQDFNVQLEVPNKKEIKKKISNYKDFFKEININTDNFSLFFCVRNY